MNGDTHVSPAWCDNVPRPDRIALHAQVQVLRQSDDPGDVATSRDPARTSGGSDMRKRTEHGYTRCTTKGTRGIQTIERIGSQIQPQANGCWLWRGRTDIYGAPSDHGKPVVVHRYVYEIIVGEIPEGHHLHHKCETLSCCNPAHLEPLTPKEHSAAHRLLDARPT